MMRLTARRLDNVAASATLGVREIAARLAAEGKDVVRVSSGEPDFDTPQNIKDAAIRAIQAGDTKYTDVVGTKALREAVVAKFKRDRGIDYVPEEVIITTGGKQVIFNALLATIDPGDEAIIPAPCWVSYPDIVKLAEGKPVVVNCGQNQGFKISPDQLEAAITPRTKWFILNNPCNPTGAAYDKSELTALTRVLARYPDVWIFTDDIYEKFSYDGFEPATIVAVDASLKNRTVTMNGCSKTYAMTGWRIGYAGAPRALIEAMNRLQGQSTANASSVSQAAAVEALNGPQDSVLAMRDVYARRRGFVVDMLNAAAGLHCHKPEGAFFVFPDIRECLGKTTAGGRRIESDTDFVAALLTEQGVAVVQGSAFLAPGHFRLSYANSDARLREACMRIQRFCAALR